MWSATKNGIGEPLHVIEGDSVLFSFGADSTNAMAQNPFTSVRVIATDNEGRIYSAKRFDYRVVVWTSGGKRISGFSGPQLNEDEVRWAPYNMDDNPVPNEIRDLQVDDAGLLWVLSWHVIPEWREYHERVVFPNGMPGIKLKEGYDIDSVYVSRIDVIDLHRGELVTQLNKPGLLIGFAGQSLLVQRVTLPSGIPQLAIWNVTLSGPQL
jgi:hypothetical protein